MATKGDSFRSQADVVAIGSGSKAKGVKSGLSDVVYLSHIPHGFYEKEMRGFFSQFGTVEKVRLARSKKSARSKGYAWIKFEDPRVALLVANTMDKYLLFGNTLRCNVMPAAKVHQNLFKNCEKTFRKASRTCGEIAEWYVMCGSWLYPR